MTTIDFDNIIKDLSEGKAPKRRTAAKKLRKTTHDTVVQPLIDALTKELLSPKAWETHYHMIMALGNTNNTLALNYLYSLVDSNSFVHMVNVALGDSLTRLENNIGSKLKTLKQSIEQNNEPLFEGSARAIALLRLDIDQDLVNNILSFTEKPDHKYLRFWPCAASPGWTGENVDNFIKSCLNSDHKDTIKAAEAALKKKYVKWNPL